MNQSARIAAAVIGMSASIALAAPQAIAAGGLSISPSIVAGSASPGVIGTVTVDNTSTVTLKITASVRPWIQAANGAVTPDARHTLASDISLSSSAFSLAAGQKQTITLTLLQTPANHSLYGNVDVLGVPPANTARNGVTVDYRLIGSLRVLPSASDEKFSAAATVVRESGTHSHGRLSVGIQNTGNTIDPIGGSFQVQGPVGSVSGTVPSKIIVPGATVFAPLTRLHGQLPPGNYTATITLTQDGSTIVKGEQRKFKIS
jgi:hypothetical protein